MLSEQEKQEITAELAHCATKASASVEALNIIQHHRGWVSDEAVSDVAHILDMTPDELDAVATFYSFIFRRPVGNHVILICDSISCWVMGYNPLLDILKTKLGITFGEIPDDWFALGAGAILLGYPVISDSPTTPASSRCIRCASSTRATRSRRSRLRAAATAAGW